MTTSYTQFKKKALRQAEVRGEYEALEPEYAVIKAIIKHRTQRGWSQKRLAEEIGSRQPVISRLERGEGNPSLRFLHRIADALDVSLHISLRK